MKVVVSAPLMKIIHQITIGTCPDAAVNRVSRARVQVVQGSQELTLDNLFAAGCRLKRDEILVQAMEGLPGITRNDTSLLLWPLFGDNGVDVFPERGAHLLPPPRRGNLSYRLFAWLAGQRVVALRWGSSILGAISRPRASKPSKIEASVVSGNSSFEPHHTPASASHSAWMSKRFAIAVLAR